jgi:hypothetical protein
MKDIQFAMNFLLVVALVQTASFGQEVTKYPTLEELGNPAKIELIQDGVKVVYTAEIVEVERTGPSPFSNIELKSPRPVYQWRTVRQRGDDEPEILGISICLDPAETGFWSDRVDVGTPWVPSITVGGGYVWVLFTRNSYTLPDFILIRTRTDEPGRPILKVSKTERIDQGKRMELDKLPSINITPHFKDGWEDNMYIKYTGRFRIKAYENGVLVMGAPVLLVASCVKEQMDSLYDTEFEVSSANYKIDPKIHPRPVHYKELMKDKEVVIRYHVEKNHWSLEVPDGFAHPRKKPAERDEK